MPTHVNLRWEEMQTAMEGTEKLKALASAYGILDPFADNNIKALQIAVAVGLDLVPGRAGPDGLDRVGNEYEIKTIDLGTKARGFSTNHHLTQDTIDRYKNRRFVFAMYEHSTLMEAYIVEPKDMAPVYTKWRDELRGRTHLNNPKISVDYVRAVGTLAYMKDVAPSWVKGKVVASA